VKKYEQKATLKIELIPESQTINNKQIKQQIRNSLNCDWLLKIQNIEIDM
jgi:translation elongation factor EF-1beta